MEQKLNIVEILKDKPIGLKLYSSTFGYIKFNGVHKDKIYFFSEDTNAHSVKQNGKMYDSGECIIFPSKEMHDWAKFSWKKGDVLVSNDGKIEVIFEKFNSDTYQSFTGKHQLDNLDENLYYQDGGVYPTAIFNIETEDAAQTYINTIEEKLGSKLNRETLEIEKQTEFKDGDIVCISGMGYLAYSIVKNIDNSSKKLEYYVLNDISTLKFEDWLSFEDKHIQPITETQQIILFDALAKKGKAWDSEKKQIVDIKKEHQFKPFEKVLVRDSYDDMWRASFFSHIKEDDGRYVTICLTWRFCVPYEGNEYLLGTTNNLEG